MVDSLNEVFYLLPTLRATRFGNNYYLYDHQPVGAPVVFVPTQRVSESIFEVVNAIRGTNPGNIAWPLAKFHALFEARQHRHAFDNLLRHGYLVAECNSMSPATEIELFDQTEARHFFAPCSAFGLPNDIEDTEVDVALVGVPFASLLNTVGTMLAPNYLRVLSRQHFSWFDIWSNGVLSEVGMSCGMPRVICQGVMVKDYGDLTLNVQTVGDLFAKAHHFVDDIVLQKDIRPLFIGGDHAVTFPLVNAFIERYPKLCLIHLDAHNDLFYSEALTFDHSSVIFDLLGYSGLDQVISFGLRSDCYSNSKALARFADLHQAERVRLHSISSLRNLLNNPDSLNAILNSVESRPCYLTIDLDILTPDAIGGKLSTPLASGLDWWELFELITAVFNHCQVIAADLVELNSMRGQYSAENQVKPISLLLHLIEGLARQRITSVLN